MTAKSGGLFALRTGFMMYCDEKPSAIRVVRSIPELVTSSGSALMNEGDVFLVDISRHHSVIAGKKGFCPFSLRMCLVVI